ncbi:hypothetical protein HHI36_012324 [Cryptolaemus montrouzieri]|uniref:Thaumatin-like protein n=1 Tax=Cryptolaemus montrouzieri TaxID=559131 RepID=A0ABD2NED3_9CUCU
MINIFQNSGFEIKGNPNHKHLRNGGFKLAQGQQVTVNADDHWAGRFWARTWCNEGTKHCLTGDCGNKLECDAGKDFYDVSLVDGFNVKASITPINGHGDGSQYSCKRAGCSAPVNEKCPPELQVKQDNNVIACKSACAAFNTDEYCCRGAHDKPETCKSSTWPKDYPAQFKQLCPDAYSYAYDDHKSTFTCKDVPTYRIEFG